MAAYKIQDNWESYSFEEFMLRKSLLNDHINLYQNQEAKFQKVKKFQNGYFWNY